MTDDNAAYEFLEGYAGSFAFLLDIKGRVEAGQLLSPRQVDAVLRCQRHEAPRRARSGSARRQPADEGMYRKEDGTIYKVQRAVNGSGNLYAKRLRVREDGSARFEYAPGEVYSLTAEERMTLHQAREFGALYGTCCVCGRTLTDETSIARGIGPICESKGRFA